MAKYRSGRLNEEIKKHVSDIIQNRIKDPRLSGLISVTNVDVTKDLSYAKVYVSIFGDEDTEKKSLDVLKKSSGFIRTELSRNLKIRHIPEIIIENDKSLEYGMHIDSILKKMDTKEK
ncbi:30S ribosome-binding factor RbfA [Hathewaya histolytica]|uniref:Ribosome-binding factor A n=1 Tax=Hathewaya histolytica TaxID=1498 RepID=A0A4U9RET2_HATHI|nr:30S ribosome-binding factor RbfA [Hathewaya histolytica]VTQ89531.1 ribosome-binding factor A [Hathewaya histolytica]